jgi:hypothetical protein
MERELRNGLMAQNILESGLMTKLMDMVNFSMLMVTYMKENGLRIRQMVEGNTHMQMAQSITDHGKMISSMARE